MIDLCVMTSVCPDMTVDQTIAAMKKHGYKGLEPRVEWGHRQGIDLTMSARQRGELKARFEDEGLVIACIATGVGMGVVDSGARDEQIGLLHEYIDLAGDLGCRYVRTFGREVLEGVEMKAVVDYVAAGYRQVIEHATDRNVVVLMETHDRWCNSAHVAAVVEQVRHPNMGVLWDFMHPQRFCEKVECTFGHVGHLTRHIHAHDARYVENNRRTKVCDLGKGVFDHATPLRLLEQAGFEGFFSVEVIHKPGSDHDAVGVMAQYAQVFAEIMSSVRGTSG